MTDTRADTLADLTADPTQWFPMPAAMVTCQPADGPANVMGIGYVGFVCWRPAIVYLGVNAERYSGRVIRDTGEFVVALPEREQVLRMDLCGFVSGIDSDKFAATGLQPVPAERVAPPLVAGAALNLECRLVDAIEVGSHNLLLGEVIETHVAEHYASGDALIEPVILVSRRYTAASEHLYDFGESIVTPPA